MKRAFFLCLTLLLAAILVPEAQAAEMIPYFLGGLDISIPETYVVFTREMEIDDETMRFMEEKNLYLDAWKEEGDQGVRVTVKDMELDTPQFLDEKGIEEWIPYFEEQSRALGDTVEKSGIYCHEQTGFHKMFLHYTNSYGVYYTIQYNTIISKKWISIEMRSGSGPISPEQEAESEAMIDSIYFRRSHFMEPVGHTDAFVYRDLETGAEFTVPENWSMEPRGKNETSYAVFYLDADPDVFILYGSADLWQQMPDWKRSGKTRETMMNPIYGSGSAAELLDISPKEVVRKQYGGKEYVAGRKAEELLNEDGELEIVGYITLLEGFENGYAYYFFFPGGEEHENYCDLEALVSSMKYPEAFDKEEAADRFRAQLLLVVAGIVLAGLALGAAFWFAARKRRGERSTEAGGEAAPEFAGRPKYCRICGTELPKDGAFCEQCGWKIKF